MSTARERAAENATEIASTLVLGLGFLALFTGFTPVPFWVIWVVGFTVVVPLVAILAGDEDAEDDWTGDWADWSGRREHRRDKQPERRAGEESDSTADALETLRERYARGDLTDEQFERKLDALFETDGPENATEWRTRERERREEEL
jgi:hypothetical protein